MKPILLCIVFLAASAWSNLFSTSIWTGYSFEKGYLKIDTTKTCNVDTTYINCSLEKGLAYYSTLDTNFAVFFMPRIARMYVSALDPNLANTTYSHTLPQVLRYEFLNWVEWGIIEMTKDSAQRLLDRLIPESKDMGGRGFVHKIACDEDPSLCPDYGPAGGGRGNGISQEDVDRLPQKKFQIDMSGSQVDSNEKPLGVQQNFAPIPRIVPPGTGYKAFDMNGIYLYRGAWNGSFTVHGNPVILKFDNGRTAVFR